MSTPAPVRARQSFRHEAFLWRGRSEFVHRLAPFIREGIAAGESVMVAVTTEHAAWLRCDLGPTADQVRFVDITELGHNPACMIPALQAFLDECSGFGVPVRAVGEAMWVGRRPEEIAECQLHEALLNLAVDPHLPLWLVCSYDDEHLDREVISEAARSHPVLARGTSYSGSPSYQGQAYASELFSAPLPAPVGPSTTMRVTRQRDVQAIPAYVIIQAAIGNVWSHQVVGLTRAVRELAAASLHRGATRVQIRFWNEPEVLICDVMDNTVIDDLLIGRRSSTSGHDPLWFANQSCDLVQARSTARDTTVRLHVRK